MYYMQSPYCVCSVGHRVRIAVGVCVPYLSKIQDCASLISPRGWSSIERVEDDKEI